MPVSRARGRTLLDLVWPDQSQSYIELAQRWSDNAVEIMMSATWNGYGDLRADYFHCIDTTQADDELERAVTQLLEPCIRNHLSGDEPYYVQHGCYEFATRQPPPAQPPQYDIAFVLTENRKIMWPVEAKVLRTDGNIAGYVRDVREEFLTGRYAPFVNGAAMVGYLFDGRTVTALTNIERALQCQLVPFRDFDTRVHRVSVHNRQLRNSEFVSGTFRCHHLIMRL